MEYFRDLGTRSLLDLVVHFLKFWKKMFILQQTFMHNLINLSQWYVVSDTIRVINATHGMEYILLYFKVRHIEFTCIFVHLSLLASASINSTSPYLENDLIEDISRCSCVLWICKLSWWVHIHRQSYLNWVHIDTFVRIWKCQFEHTEMLTVN